MRLSIKSAAAVAGALALTAFGCGGGGNGGSTNTASGGATASSAAGACRASDLRIQLLAGNAATGRVLAPFGIRNASGHPCTLRGFPHVVLLDRSGRAMGVAVKPRSVDFFGHLAVRKVALAAGGQASFRLAFSDAINGGNCPTAATVRVTLPSAGGSLSAALSGQLACPGGVTVSPFAPDHAAFG